MQVLLKGDLPGHEFHGNQWTEGAGNPSFDSARAFDAWAKGQATRDPEQFSSRSGDDGVALLTVKQGDVTTTYDGGMTGRQAVVRDSSDVRLVYRLDNDRLVWWEQETGKTHTVEPNDPRLKFKPGKETPPAVAPTREPHEMAVEVDGEQHTYLLPDHPARMSDSDFEDEMQMSGADPAVIDAFRQYRASNRVGKADLLGRLKKIEPASRPLAALLKANLDQAAHRASPSIFNLKKPPTEAQAKAGNYPKGHWSLKGLRFAIENPEHSHRRPEWPPLSAHYGYVKGTVGADGDQVDAFLRPATDERWDGPVFVIDQVDENGDFDEHKVMIGWDNERTAVHDYLRNYPSGWKVGEVTQLTVDELKQWLANEDTTQPIAGQLLQRLGKEWTQSASPTSGITSYGRTRARREKLKRIKRSLPITPAQ